MPENIGLTKNEQKLLDRAARAINKKLVMKDLEPLKQSEIMHEILDIALRFVDVNRRGQIYLKDAAFNEEKETLKDV